MQGIEDIQNLVSFLSTLWSVTLEMQMGSTVRKMLLSGVPQGTQCVMKSGHKWHRSCCDMVSCHQLVYGNSLGADKPKSKRIRTF